MKAAADKHAHQHRIDKICKQSADYQKKRRSARYTTCDASTQHDYGVTAQQPDIPQDELNVLCSECYSREIAVNSHDAEKIERERRDSSPTVPSGITTEDYASQLLTLVLWQRGDQQHLLQTW